MTQEMVGVNPDKLFGLAIDLLEKCRKGVFTQSEVELFLQRQNPFNNSWQGEIIRLTQQKLRKKLEQIIQPPGLPAAITKELFNKFAGFNMRLCFLPALDITEDFNCRGYIKPQQWFYEKIIEGKIAKDATQLPGIWVFADFSKAVDYTDGTQVFHKDSLTSLISQLRWAGKIGKNDKTPIGSRFTITNDEWRNVVAPAFAELIGVNPCQVRLERTIEFNFIGNVYDKNRGRSNIWQWFQDEFGQSYRLYGGSRDYGGLANVDYHSADNRVCDICGRLLVEF